MNNKMLKRAIAATAGVGLALTSLVGIAAPAQAAGPVVTKFKIHLNVPKSVAEQWNLWYWGAGAGVEPTDNTIGNLTKTIGGVAYTQDWTPNFVNEDAWGVYAEFTLPGKLTALNNVMRTTESWDGQEADANATPPKVAIESADKPFGGDNIFPAGESWWNVGTGARAYPLKGFKAGTRTIKVHVNAPLATVQNAGFSLWAWGRKGDVKVVLKNVKVGKVYPYAGKVPDTGEGVPFTASDSYGAVALINVPKEVGPYSATGFILRRSTPSNLWAKQSVDWMIPNDATDAYVNVGVNTPAGWGMGNFDVTYNSKPAFIGRYGATATYANGRITVTPVRPSAAALKGAQPDKIEVTLKVGGNNFANNKCTISTKIFEANIDDFSWAMPTTCDVTVPAPGADEITYEVFVQASASGIGTGLASAKPNAKVVVPAT